MGTQLKSLRKSCPVCTYTVIIDVEFQGKKVKFSIFCPHCYKKEIETLIEIEIKNKTTMSVTSNPIKIMFLILILSALFLFTIDSIKAKKNITCNAFKTQIEAQQIFDSNRIKYQNLDKNYNNVPCEDLLN